METLKSNILSLKGPVLVLGASGFIGSNLYRLIASFRSDVFAVVQNEKSWRLDDVSEDKIITVDLMNDVLTQNMMTFHD